MAGKKGDEEYLATVFREHGAITAIQISKSTKQFPPGISVIVSMELYNLIGDLLTAIDSREA